MSTAFPSLVSTEWLAHHLEDEDLVVLDASFKLPGTTPTAFEDYQAGHIAGAVFFDIDAVADPTSALPHMLPAAGDFARAVTAMGVSNRSRIVVYDAPGLMSAGRAWWSFRAFGHRAVAVLDGGLRAWRAEGRPVTAEATAKAPRHSAASQFRANPVAGFVATRDEVRANLDTRARGIVDARSAPRFTAAEPEARPGLRSGHIPGSLNVPFTLMTDPDTGRVKSPEQIRAIFAQAGLDMTRPAIASCGSGVTACALAFALHLAGKDDVAVYDGAWAEWGLPGDTPVAP